MVKEIFSNWLGVTKNTADIANNAAIDAAQATDIANNTAINVAQSADIANLAAENASQAEKITNLSEAVADQQKIMIACIAVSAVAAVALTCFVVCICYGIKCEREKEKNLSKDTPGTELNNLGKSNTSGTKLDADGGTKLSNLEVNGSKSVNNIAA